MTASAIVDPIEQYLPVAGGRLYVRTIGRGRPMLVLHGGPDFNHRYLLPEMDGLSHAFKLIYYDQRGRGRSAAGIAPEDITIESEIDDVDAIRKHFGFRTMALLGHSWGGLLSLEYASRHPERVACLVLLNTAPARHSDWMLLRERRRALESHVLATMQAIASTPAYVEGDVAAEAKYYRAHFAGTLRQADVDRIVDRLRIDFQPDDIVKARAIEERLCAQTWLSSGYDAVAKLARFAPPTLIVHGDRDLIPVECAAHIAEVVRGARFVVLDDCGHFAYVDQPARLFDAIVSFATASLREP